MKMKYQREGGQDSLKPSQKSIDQSVKRKEKYKNFLDDEVLDELDELDTYDDEDDEDSMMYSDDSFEEDEEEEI